ncbi:methyltransferase domain-containing protein [Limnohabitans sp. Jir72]|uniref:class I SAM-dependent methyltransferase n=1 Tax=Limnohabitans sp. Jir72 TaxID=1977909 RepID=UPI000D3A6541|nr:methyltransferase domain-containing protein [Limnohabitans sp. Jir72]PUE24039.1 hypothetical protein B9Z52_17270 [Limnohabitans sp. Jir72]
MNLHIGGVEKKEGWLILNINPGPNVDIVGDFRDNFKDKSSIFDNIYLSHVLEHTPHAETLTILKKLNQLLKPQGKIFISVPDLDHLCHFFVSPNASINEKYQAMKIIFGGQIDNNDFHYSGFNYQFLSHLLLEAGFSHIQRVDNFGLFKDTSNHYFAHHLVSLNVIAQK